MEALSANSAVLILMNWSLKASSLTFAKADSVGFTMYSNFLTIGSFNLRAVNPFEQIY